MRRRKSRVARAAKSSEGAMFAAGLAKVRQEWAEERKREGFFGRGQGDTLTGQPSWSGCQTPQTRGNTGVVRVVSPDRAPETLSRGARATHDESPREAPGSGGAPIHTTSYTLTTLTTLTEPATARDCAVRVPPSRADHPDQIEDFGDEREHDLWLSGVSIHDLP